MPPFRFRLETLLRLRVADRDQRRAELGKAQEAEALLQGKIDEIQHERQNLADHARRLAAPGTADIDALVRAHRYELVLKTQTQQLAGQLAQVREELARRRQALVEADRGVRVLEKLRDGQQTAHETRRLKLEQQEIDEQAVLGFVRQEASP